MTFDVVFYLRQGRAFHRRFCKTVPRRAKDGTANFSTTKPVGDSTFPLTATFLSNQDAVGEVLDLKVGKARNTRLGDRDTREPVCQSLDVDRSRGSHMLQSGLLLTAIARTT